MANPVSRASAVAEARAGPIALSAREGRAY